MKKRMIIIAILSVFSIIVLFFLTTIPALRAPLKKVTQPDPWETWLNKQVDIQLEEALRVVKAEAPWELHQVEAEIAQGEEFFRAHFQKMMVDLKEVSDTPPPLRIIPHKEFVEQFEDDGAGEMKTHEGPQTAEAIVNSFEGMLPHTLPEVEAAYPQKEWVQMLLDRDIVIKDYGHYAGYMSARFWLHRLKESPEKWQGDWETTKNALIDRKIWEYQTLRAAMDADDTIHAGLFPGADGKTFLPLGGGRVYIGLERHEDGTITTSVSGPPLTEEQQFNIFYRGIEPEGYQVIYHDKEYQPLSEPFQPLTPEEVLSPEQYQKYLEREDQMMGDRVRKDLMDVLKDALK